MTLKGIRMKTLTFTLLMSIGLLAGNANADDMSDMKDMKDMKMPSSKMVAPEKAITGKGTVVSVNKADSSVILKHDAIAAISWPAMTMNFKVKDKILLDKTKSGDKVDFTLEKDGANYIITDIK